MNSIESKKGWALLSGGKDSMLTALKMSNEDRLDGVVFIDTGIGLNETREYVHNVSSGPRGSSITLRTSYT